MSAFELPPPVVRPLRIAAATAAASLVALTVWTFGATTCRCAAPPPTLVAPVRVIDPAALVGVYDGPRGRLIVDAAGRWSACSWGAQGSWRVAGDRVVLTDDDGGTHQLRVADDGALHGALFGAGDERPGKIWTPLDAPPRAGTPLDAAIGGGATVDGAPIGDAAMNATQRGAR